MLKKPPSEGGLVRLPGDLAERIVELQLELEEGQLSEAALGRLLAAYSQAINYYIELRNERYHHYQNKIKRLFHDERVMKLLGEYSTQQACLNLHHQIVDAKEVAHKEARNMLQQSESAECRTSQRIICQLSHQKQNILDRVRERSESRLKQQRNRPQSTAKPQSEYMLK